MNKVKKTILSKICFYLDELLRMKIINCEDFRLLKEGAMNVNLKKVFTIFKEKNEEFLKNHLIFYYYGTTLQNRLYIFFFKKKKKTTTKKIYFHFLFSFEIKKIFVQVTVFVHQA